MKVVHLEAGRHLLGGPRQVAYLLDGLKRAGSTENVLVCPKSSEIARKARQKTRTIDVQLSGDLDLRFIPAFRRILRSEAPDIVHLHSRRGADYLGGIAARLEHYPVVLSRRVDNPEPRWLAPYKYRLYDKVIAISDYVRRSLIDSGISAQKIVVVPSAVDSEHYCPIKDRALLQQEFGIETGMLVVGMVAHFIPRKGHRFLLEALPLVLERIPRLKVLCFGRGDGAAQFARQVVRAGLSDYVTLAGFRDDLHRLLGGLDVLVHPATREGLGVSLLQAASCGVPIVASRIGGIPEVVQDGITGLLVPPEDPPALADALVRILGDPNRARRMAAEGRSWVIERFGVEQMVAGTLAVYRDLLRGPMPGGADAGVTP